MDRRRLVLAASSAAGRSGSGVLPRGSVRAQVVRSRSPEYAGAMTVMWRTVQWVLQEVSRLMAAQDRSDEEWRIDVLAPFAVVTTIRDAARAIVPPAKYAAGHALWLDALDELVSAGLYLRNGVLTNTERSFPLATRAIESATDLIAEVEVALPRRVRRTP
jgi:hypothetical protein